MTSFAIKIVGIKGETLDEVVNLAYDYAANWRKDKLTQKENIKAIFQIANDKFEDIVKILILLKLVSSFNSILFSL